MRVVGGGCCVVGEGGAGPPTGTRASRACSLRSFAGREDGVVGGRAGERMGGVGLMGR